MNSQLELSHVLFQNPGWPEFGYVDKNKDQASSHQHNRKALVDLLHASGKDVIELYRIWDGDFALPPEAREAIPTETILDSSFSFKERGFYKVVFERAGAERSLPEPDSA